ncbi:MupA/Atu3671 family FMN-dependent luciferase-like monooxygenase [Yoonia sp. SS1-5]|uniref:MupA/Atu3671 family FMN-dependent luciferase-like monooxygenase n=1 Tax=Yoonia rhodophyticola TaxID=3137370 RepID=A0AAN0MC64_9RHOB
MSSFSCILIGNESLLTHCGDMLLSQGHQINTVVTRDADIQIWAQEKGIATTTPGAGLAGRLGPCDWVLSIANLSIVPDDVIALADKGAVNFHDGPLPRYAGLNVPVWAILNGETQHGITWHMIEGGVDEGAIIEQRMFDIAADETALTLNAKCFAAAIDGFEAVIAQLATGAPATTAQDFTDRQLFARADRPAAAGVLDFTTDTTTLLRMVRGLDHGHYWNPLTCPKIMIGDKAVVVGKAEIAEGSGAPGTILAADTDALTVATANAAIRLSDLKDVNGQPLAGAAMPAQGDVLTAPDAAALTSQMAQIAPGELHWRRMLKTASPMTLAEICEGADGTPAQQPINSNLPPEQLITAFYCLMSRLSEEGNISLALHGNGLPDAPGILSRWVPLYAPGETVRDVAANLAEELSFATKHPAFALDLVARDPEIETLAQPQVGIALGGDGLVDGTAVTMVWGDNGPALAYDTARISDAGAARIIDRLGCLATGFAEDARVADLPIMPEAERAMVLHEWNQTGTAYDPTPMHQMFEAQVSRTPDATALVFEGATYTYAALNAAANKTAHILKESGVSTGTMVGLHTHRSAEMLIGALAILKAGGAYVPMDPAFPADRIAYYIADSTAPIIVTQSDLAAKLPPHQAQVLSIDTDPRLAAAPNTNPDSASGADDLAYMIYTSGSTGKPKGVMVEHGNVANFFVGMDDRIPHDGDGVWLAVTSLSFDISVLELFYTLARGYKLVISGDESRALVSGGTGGAVPVSDQNMDFSLYYWGNNDEVSDNRYELLIEGAKFADANGFCAVWTPERHFHAFGGSYPNPSVTGAAVASVTKNLAVRAGSIVAPLHHPARIAEEWAVIDNLTGGRVGLAMASGWQPDDFVLRPENTPPDNKPALADAIDKVRRLWAGETVEFERKDGKMHGVVTQPRPVSKKIPMWVTTAGNPATWAQAGEVGANVLTHLLGQSIDEVGEKIKVYHDALRKAGHDPKDHKVTLMLHTFLADDREKARDIAREPMKDYLRAAAGLIKQYAWAFPAFKKPEGAANPMDIDLGSLEPDELEAILDFAFLRYFDDSGLFGTVDDAVARVEALKKIGVDEVACLIEYGIDTKTVLDGLRPLAQVLAAVNGPVAEIAADDFSIAAQIKRHKVTHLQCTPSMARMICMNDDAANALSHVKHLMIGGEALSGSLVAELNGYTSASVENMYGPTETTIWSTTQTASADDGIVNIGKPIANTQIYVLDEAQQPVPIGVPGELYIAGDGVTRGYWQRPELTAERFLPDPFVQTDKPGPRMYRTGDLVRWRADGRVDFLGRTDHQVKVRGYRIELGEIETRLEAVPDVTQAVVMAREDTPGDTRLVAYMTTSGPTDDSKLRTHLAADLPAYMIPAHFVTLPAFPLTPNKKVDRKALPKPIAARPAPPPKPVVAATPTAAGTDVVDAMTQIWSGILGVAKIGPDDNFFALGGHSLLAVQAHRDMRDQLGLTPLSITDIFRFPTIGGLTQHLGVGAAPKPAAAPAAVAGRAQTRADAMARRRNMRANRAGSNR